MTESQKEIVKDIEKESKQDWQKDFGYYAPTKEKGVEKAVKQYNAAKKERDEYLSKQYKPTQKRVEVGSKYDEYGKSVSIQAVNERRRAARIKASEAAMKEAVDMLKLFGLHESEIIQLTEPKSGRSYKGVDFIDNNDGTGVVDGVAVNYIERSDSGKRIYNIDVDVAKSLLKTSIS